MAKWLRARTALPEDPHGGSVPGTHVVPYNNPNSSLRGSYALYGHLTTIHGADTYMQAKY